VPVDRQVLLEPVLGRGPQPRPGYVERIEGEVEQRFLSQTGQQHEQHQQPVQLRIPAGGAGRVEAKSWILRLNCGFRAGTGRVVI
jgi:hypothetical protein